MDAFIACRIAGTCNALVLSGLFKKTPARLQLLQNSAVHLLKRAHITSIYSFLVKNFKILLLVSKALDCLCPRFAFNLWTLESSGRGLLIIRKVRTKTNCEASFYYTGNSYSLSEWQQGMLLFLKANSRPIFGFGFYLNYIYSFIYLYIWIYLINIYLAYLFRLFNLLLFCFVYLQYNIYV